MMSRMGVVRRWCIAAFVLSELGMLLSCLGSDPDTVGGSEGGSLSDGAPPTVSTDGGVPPLAPDAAPSLGCPLGCLPPAPPGWIGPSAIYDGPTAGRPASCPPVYVQEEIVAGEDVTAAPADCSCGAPTFTGTRCDATASFFTSSDCSTTPVTVDVRIPGFNECLARASYSGVRVTAATFVPGTCSFPNPTKTVTEPSFGRSTIACGLAQKASCDGRPDCTASPSPEGGFTRLCIHREGEQSCPSLDYSVRLIAYRGTVDGRECTPCTGTPTGTCGSSVKFSSNTGCSIEIGDAGKTGACLPTTGPGIDLRALAASNLGCTPSGGTPTGDVTASDPITFCCNK